MLENLFLKEEEEMTPESLVYIFFLTAVISVISIAITKYLLKFEQGLLSVFIISLACAYPIIKFLKEEAREEEYLANKETEESLLMRHFKEIGLYLSFFFAVVFVFALAYYQLPPEFFSIQLDTIGSITGNATQGGLFWTITINNLRIFSLTFLLSFLVSAGMILILVWNASVFGVFLAKTSRTVHNLPLLFTAYFPHGAIEVAAYIVAGIAGLLVSTHFEDIKNEDSSVTIKIFEDVSFLVLIGIGLVFLGAAIEVI